MTIVYLEDDTTYLIDTDNGVDAIRVVSSKLRNRVDKRKIVKVEVQEGVELPRHSRYYNTSNAYDGVSLKAKTGWDYKWSGGRNAIN